MYPRRNSRRRRSSSQSSRQIRRLWLIAAGTSVPVLIIAYSVATAYGGRAANTADGWGIGLHLTQGHTEGADGWGRGGYMMMPGPAGSSVAESGAASATPSSATAAAGPRTASTSQNWAGYTSAGKPGTFTSVSASWAEPTVTCDANQTFSSFWVGLDGDGTNMVEQTGTEADCTNGAAIYQGWFEMFPNAPVFYNSPVDPGDAMSASVVANGGGSFTLTLNDSTQGWTQIAKQTSNIAQLGSAEIIAEAPSDGQVLPLSDFGTVNFADALINNAAIGNLSTTAVTMESAANVTEATPSALTNGDAFAVTFDGSGAGTAAVGPGIGFGPGTGTGNGTGAGTGSSTGSHHRHHHYLGLGG
jgi:Peptidase A4 family